MIFTPREIAHLLATLRTCQTQGINREWHFDETEPLSDAEVDTLCQRINEAGPDVELGEKTDGESGGDFHEASGRSPSRAPDEGPCGGPNAAPTQEEERGPNRAFTVVGLFPQCDWDGSVRDASFVEFVEATSPHEAAKSARIHAARNRLVFEAEMPEDELLKEAEKQGFQIETLAVFEGHIPDVYDPEGASPSE